MSTEIGLYAASPCVDVETNLLTWQDRAPVLPVLAVLAKKYLCIQASSSPSERLFSKAGQVITANRSQLNQIKQICLCFYLRICKAVRMHYSEIQFVTCFCVKIYNIFTG